MKTIFIITSVLAVTFCIGCGEKPKPEGTVVTISLSKNTYKLYEPILLQYEWINYKDKPDSIWAIFGPPYFIKQYITDEKGNSYQHQLQTNAMVGYVLNYVLYKNDSLRKSMHINLFGKKFGGRGDSTVFYSDAYFPPGNYKIFSVIDRDAGGIVYNPPIKTNEIEFKVEELSEEDTEIIRLVKNRDFETPLNLYNKNYFEEHLLYWNIMENVGKFTVADEDNDRYKDTSNLGSKFRNFFDRYPNSLYNLQSWFFMPYFRVISRDSAGAYNEINKLLNDYQNTTISTELNQFIKTEKQRGKTWIWMAGIHYKKGKSEVVNPAPQK